MARAQSIEGPGGRYHVTARGAARLGLDRGPAKVATWAEIVDVLEHAEVESWAGFANRHGDWGRDAVLWLGRRVGRLRLMEVGQLAGGLDYEVVSKALARFGRRLALDVSLSKQVAAFENQLST